MCVCVCIRILFPNITVIKFLSKDTNPIESILRIISPISSSSFQSPNQLLILKPHSHHAPRPLLHNPIQRLSKSYRIFLSNSRHSDWTIKFYPSILSKRVKKIIIIIIINEKCKKKYANYSSISTSFSSSWKKKRGGDRHGVSKSIRVCGIGVCACAIVRVYIYIYMCVRVCNSNRCVEWCEWHNYRSPSRQSRLSTPPPRCTATRNRCIVHPCSETRSLRNLLHTPHSCTFNPLTDATRS